jgi:hypothetical protein
MLVTPVNEWGWVASSVADGTQPSATYGTALTPSTNAYGSWVTLISGANLINDVWEIDIVAHDFYVSAVARDTLVGFGVDPAGGTSFTSLADLVCGPVGPLQSGGCSFKFPLFIKAGSSIGMRASVNSANVTTGYVYCTVRGLPSHPEAVRAGSYIDQFGVSTATSAGTAVTPGSASEGAWAELGTLTRPCWHWNYGLGVSDSTMTLAHHHIDLSIGSAASKKTVIQNAMALLNASEDLYKWPNGWGYGMGATGDKVYGRMQSAATPDTGYTMAAYGVGG